jgi:hypothetical protein
VIGRSGNSSGAEDANLRSPDDPITRSADEVTELSLDGYESSMDARNLFSAVFLKVLLLLVMPQVPGRRV